MYLQLKNEYKILEEKYQEAVEVKSNLNKDQRRRVQELEDELVYLKRHSDMENGLLKDENNILKKEVEQYIKGRYLGESNSHYNLTPNAKHQQSLLAPMQ